MADTVLINPEQLDGTLILPSGRLVLKYKCDEVHPIPPDPDKERMGPERSATKPFKSPEEFSYNVFISHASEDKPTVKQLIRDFRKKNITYWVDEEQITPVDRVTEKIEEGLEQSKYVLVCLSANLGRSHWVRAEYGPILNKEFNRDSRISVKRVITLKLDDSSDDDIPLLLYDKKRTNYSNKTEYRHLLEFLKT
jgi:hypothetical protein